ncbi:HAD-IA family hydrolase [Ktedonobacter robiniae]|uniref:HAD-IA family hydrolase n=1 Tax=Ktedonobacter robiniae TaxID=2778365 RepID=UPI0019159591|nr:HAD-IA family hydrolase [Ktedonobacter robiniae]
MIDIDWEKYKEDQCRGVSISNLWASYETLNTTLFQFLVQMRPLYKIATLCNGGSREAMDRKFRLGEMVDLMVFDGEEGISKPDARIYLRTLARLGVNPEEAVFVDDKPINVEAAQELGIHALHFKDTAQILAELRAVLQIPS